MKKIVVGIPSLNSEETISFATSQIAKGLTANFTDYQLFIVNSDGGSKDSTVKNFLNTKTPGIEKISLSETGPKGKGNGLKNIFKFIKKENAIAGATFDADLQAITPAWIKDMLLPIVNQNFDYATPLYLRHKYDGTITNTIAYPLTTALYGKKIRQPIGGDFAFSSHLVAKWLAENPPYNFGIDIFMTTTALINDFRICQVYLGPKIHQPKDPEDLKNMFIEVIDTLFKLADQNKNKWQKIDTIEKTPIFGTKSNKTAPKINIDLQKLRKYGTISQREWVKAVYDHLVKKQPAENLVPYYLKATASLIFENWDLEKLIKLFLELKPK